MLLNVGKIEVVWEGEDGYVPIKEEFKPFESDYVEEAKTPVERANLERLEIWSLMMLDLGQKMAGAGAKVSDVWAGVKWGVQSEVRGG